MSKPYGTRALSALTVSDLEKFLGTAYSRKLAHNTYVELNGGGELTIRLHATRILTFHGDGTFTVRSGGWESTTTKQRLNALLPTGYRIFSKSYRWMISTPDGDFDFSDGDRWGEPAHDRINGHYGGHGCGCPIPEAKPRPTCRFPHNAWSWCGQFCENSAPDGSFETAEEKRARLNGCECSCHPFQARHGNASSPCTGCGCKAVA